MTPWSAEPWMKTPVLPLTSAIFSVTSSYLSSGLQSLECSRLNPVPMISQCLYRERAAGLGLEALLLPTRGDKWPPGDSGPYLVI